MQYKIQGSPKQVQDLTPLFFDYTYTIKNNVLLVLTDEDNDSELLPFLSMVNAPVMIDYMTQNTIKLTLL